MLRWRRVRGMEGMYTVKEYFTLHGRGPHGFKLLEGETPVVEQPAAEETNPKQLMEANDAEIKKALEE